MTRAAIYARISQDRGGGGLGVARQEEDCRALCQRRSWDVVEVFVDNDVSAYSGAPRPSWQRLLEAVRAGTVDALACWHVDRLTRSPRELEDVIDLADRHGLELATVSGEIDLSTPTGRMIARMLGAAARHEAEHKAERQKRQRRQAAEAGRVSGGGTRPYGYGDDRLTIVETEAAVIRECVSRVLAGESLSSICRELAERGVSTPLGGRWQPRTLRRLLASARISGRREHRPRSTHETGTRPLLGEIVADAVWPAIISRADSDKVRALLADPDRARKFSPTSSGRKYLLSGILRCGRCGAGMVGRPRSGVPRYVCPNPPGGGSCGGMATNAERTDQHVFEMLVAALASPELLERLTRSEPTGDDLSHQLADDEAQMEELARAWARREISRAEWMAARSPIEIRIQSARATMVRSPVGCQIEQFIGPAELMRDRWGALNVSQRRAVVGAVIRSITVHPAARGRRWDPQRFAPEWLA